MKKEYISPEFHYLRVDMRDVLQSSWEHNSSHINEPDPDVPPNPGGDDEWNW